MPRTLGRSRNFGNQRDDFLGELHVLGFLGIDAEPAEMFQAELRGALRLVLGELAEIIVKAVGGTAVKARPKRRFADRLATGQRHALVIVRDAADHVGMGFDVAHGMGLKVTGVGFQPFFPAQATGRAFAFRFGNGPGGRVAEGEQDLFRLFALPAVQFAERGAKGFQAKIILAIGTFHAVKEGGDFNELVPRVEEIEVENLLSSHIVYDLRYDDFSRRGKS